MHGSTAAGLSNNQAQLTAQLLTPNPPRLLFDPAAAIVAVLLLAARLSSGLYSDACRLSWPAALCWRVAGLDAAAEGGWLLTSSPKPPQAEVAAPALLAVSWSSFLEEAAQANTEAHNSLHTPSAYLTTAPG